MDRKHIEAIAVKLGAPRSDNGHDVAESEAPEMDNVSAEHDAAEALIEGLKQDDKEAIVSSLKSLFQMWDESEDEAEGESEAPEE
jgi:hypothetical protein